MKEDTKVFLKYIFNLGGFIEGLFSELKKNLEPKRISSIFIIFAVFFLINLPSPKNGYIALILFIIAFLIQLNVVYKSGDHRYWNRQRLGLKSKKELMKEEWDAKKGDTNPKSNINNHIGVRR